ncbi:MAG: hypothetical protein K8R23_13130 [Chthoniobacter sp.]|nr:hypothetical protein [Chthoniobacter sp.]
MKFLKASSPASKKHAIPFVDLTPISVIERWADHFEGQKTETNGHPKTASPTPELPGKMFSPVNPPDLMHTRCRGTFGTLPFRKWNNLVRIAHTQAFAKAQSFEALRAVTPAQIRKGDHSGDSGYHFLPEIGISVQGVDANHAWQYTLGLAQFLKTPLRASVEWRHNDKAAFPGEMGTIEWAR